MSTLYTLQNRSGSRKNPIACSRGSLPAWAVMRRGLLLGVLVMAIGCSADEGWKPGSPDTIHAERLRLGNQFSNFLFALETFVAVEDRANEFPLQKSSLTEIVQLVFEGQSWNKEARESCYAELSDGKDPWGNDLLFFESGEGVWTLRSAGPNKVDEGGGGDDVEKSVDLSGLIGK